MRLLAKTILVLGLLVTAPAFAQEHPPARVGRVSLISGTLAFYGPGETDWSAVKLNFPVAAGGWFATDPQSRAQIRVGADAIDLAENTELEIADLRDGVMQISLTQGRTDLHLRQLGNGESAEIDIPRGGVWPLQPGVYDIEAGTPDQPARVIVFQGSARFVGGGVDQTVEAGDMLVLSGSDTLSATIEPAAPDAFVTWCRAHDYDQSRVAASRYVSPEMTGFEELDTYGGWQSAPDYGAVWYPKSVPADWAPYRDGHWVWVEPWGWNWVDAEPWGFAPFHYGRWARVDDRWGWVPGNFVQQPVYAPALVAFLDGPGIGASIGGLGAIGGGPVVGWFPLAPGEVYWPSYSRDPTYIRNVNIANVSNTRITNITTVVAAQPSGDPPPQIANQQFANRAAATVVPARVFADSARVGPAALQVSPPVLQQVPVSARPPQLTPAGARLVPAATTGAAPNPAIPPALALHVPAALPAAPAHSHPPTPPNFTRLAPAPTGRGGPSEIARQPAPAVPATGAPGHPPGPPNFSRLAPATQAHGPAPAARPALPGASMPAAPGTSGRSLQPVQAAPTAAVPGHPPGPPNFPHPAPATAAHGPLPPTQPPAAQPPAPAALGPGAHGPSERIRQPVREIPAAAAPAYAAPAPITHAPARSAAQIPMPRATVPGPPAVRPELQRGFGQQQLPHPAAVQQQAVAHQPAPPRAAAQPPAVAHPQVQQHAAAPRQGQAHENCGHPGQAACPR